MTASDVTLIDRALDMFEARGYDATGVDELAAAANVSRRTFFRHFNGKDDVILQSHKQRVTAFCAHLETAPGATAVDRVIVATEQALADVWRDPDTHRRRYRIVFDNPALHCRLRGTDLDYEQAAAAHLASSYPKGSPEPTMIAAAGLAAVNHALRDLAHGVSSEACRRTLHDALADLRRAASRRTASHRTVVIVAETDHPAEDLLTALRDRGVIGHRTAVHHEP